MLAPEILTSPESDKTGLSPRIASANSVWPFPCTPAIARISPARTSKLTWFTARCSRSSNTDTRSSCNTTLPGLERFFSTVSPTSRPTIMLASSFVSALGLASPTTRPCRITVILSATAFTSRSLWVIKTIEVPDFARPRMMSISSSVSCGVNTAVGSSRTSILASRASDFMISTRC